MLDDANQENQVKPVIRQRWVEKHTLEDIYLVKTARKLLERMTGFNADGIKPQASGFGNKQPGAGANVQ